MQSWVAGRGAHSETLRLWVASQEGLDPLLGGDLTRTHGSRWERASQGENDLTNCRDAGGWAGMGLSGHLPQADTPSSDQQLHNALPQTPPSRTAAAGETEVYARKFPATLVWTGFSQEGIGNTPSWGGGEG